MYRYIRNHQIFADQRQFEQLISSPRAQVAGAEFLSSEPFNRLCSLIHKLDMGVSVTCDDLIQSIKNIGVDTDSSLGDHNLCCIDLESYLGRIAVPGFRKSNDFFTLKTSHLHELILHKHYISCISEYDCVSAATSLFDCMLSHLSLLHIDEHCDDKLISDDPSECFAGGEYRSDSPNVAQRSLDFSNDKVEGCESIVKIYSSLSSRVDYDTFLTAAKRTNFFGMFPQGVFISEDDAGHILVDVDGRCEGFLVSSIDELIDGFIDIGVDVDDLIAACNANDIDAVYDLIDPFEKAFTGGYDLSTTCGFMSEVVFSSGEVVSDFLHYLASNL